MAMVATDGRGTDNILEGHLVFRNVVYLMFITSCFYSLREDRSYLDATETSEILGEKSLHLISNIEIIDIFF